MLSPETEVFTARTLEEALQLRAAHPQAVPLAGGTDLMVMLESGRWSAPAFLNLWGCAGLRDISQDGRRIGALATWSDVAEHPAIPSALRDCARTVGAEQIQRRGTVGGNIVNASPAGDSLPLWLALDAEFELSSLRGVRKVAADAFFEGYRKVALAPDELLTAVILPELKGTLGYRKVGTRQAQSISKVMLGGRLWVEGGQVVEARIALGAVAPVPLRLKKLEAALVGGAVRPELAEEVGEEIRPITDIRSTSQYRLAVARNIVRRWLQSQGGS